MALDSRWGRGEGKRVAGICRFIDLYERLLVPLGLGLVLLLLSRLWDTQLSSHAMLARAY
jgi:hypothetical protein